MCFLKTILFLISSLFYFKQIFMTIPKHFITWYLCQENIPRGVFCLGVVCIAFKDNLTIFFLHGGVCV